MPGNFFQISTGHKQGVNKEKKKNPFLARTNKKETFKSTFLSQAENKRIK